MVVFFGTARYGTVDRCDGVFVATHFAHFFGLPLVPLQSVLVTPDGERPIAMSARSVIAAYLRFWPIAAAIAVVVSWWPAFWIFLRPNGPTPMIVVLLLCAVFGWTLLGRPDARDVERRRLYARAIGQAIDPALLGEERRLLRDRLRAAYEERAPQVATSYRDAQTDVAALATSSGDPLLMGIAAARLRVEASLADGEARHRLVVEHDAIVSAARDRKDARTFG